MAEKKASRKRADKKPGAGLTLQNTGGNLSVHGVPEDVVQCVKVNCLFEKVDMSGYLLDIIIDYFGPRKGLRKKPAVSMDQFRAMQDTVDLDT
jgi:hypothetical protein